MTWSVHREVAVEMQSNENLWRKSRFYRLWKYNLRGWWRRHTGTFQYSQRKAAHTNFCLFKTCDWCLMFSGNLTRNAMQNTKDVLVDYTGTLHCVRVKCAVIEPHKQWAWSILTSLIHRKQNGVLFAKILHICRSWVMSTCTLVEVDSYQTTQRRTTEDITVHSSRRENLVYISYLKYVSSQWIFNKLQEKLFFASLQ